MFKRDIEKGLVFKIPESHYPLKSSIQMFFMRTSLDILFINEENKIHEMVTLNTWKLHVPKKPAKYVVELKGNTITTESIEINDEIIIKNMG